MTDQQTARVAVDMIKEKLDRIKIHLLNQRINLQAQALLDNAYGIRILDSRKRLLERLFNIKYGTEEQKLVAKIELSLKTQDTGKLIQDENGRQHVQGRLDCRGCDTKPGIGDMPVPMTRLCTLCRFGLEHFYTVVKQVEPLSTSGMGLSVEPSRLLLQYALYCRRISVCENCQTQAVIEDWREEPAEEHEPREIRINLP